MSRENIQFENRHYYALVGLSLPKDKDYVLGEDIPFKLSNNEKKFLLEETPIHTNLNMAVEDANQYFQKKYKNGNVYYRNSRWAGGGSLQYLKYKTVLNDLVEVKETL